MSTRITAVKTYHFTVTLAGMPTPDTMLDDAAWDGQMAALLDDLTGRMMASGLDAAGLSGIGSCGGVFSLSFDREAESLGDAIGSAVADVVRAGCSVSRVDVDAG